MKTLYVILLADKEGNFEWIYTLPNPFYPTREEAEQVRIDLISKEQTITEENSKVQRMYKLEN